MPAGGCRGGGGGELRAAAHPVNHCARSLSTQTCKRVLPTDDGILPTKLYTHRWALLQSQAPEPRRTARR